MYRCTKELDALPDQAIVYDSSCQVWQKLCYRDRHDVGFKWFKPGESVGYHALKIELPARLLDDGL